MKFDRIKYTKYFKESDEWIGTEAQVEDGDNLTDAFSSAKRFVEAAKSHTSERIIADIQLKDQNGPTGNLISDIKSCMDEKVLESYRFIIKGNAEAEAAYEETMKKIKYTPGENKL